MRLGGIKASGTWRRMLVYFNRDLRLLVCSCIDIAHFILRGDYYRACRAKAAKERRRRRISTLLGLDLFIGRRAVARAI